MAKTIQAEAVITAVDKTGNTFAGIGEKVKGLAASVSSLGGIATGGVEALDKLVSRTSQVMATISPVASAAASYEMARGTRDLVHMSFQAGADYAHEIARQRAAGMKEED